MEILSPLPNVISLPVTVKSPLMVVVVAVIATVPSLLFDIVSPLPNVISFPVMVRSSPTVASPAIATEELAIVACGVMVRWVT